MTTRHRNSLRDSAQAIEPVVDGVATILAILILPVLYVEAVSTDPRWLQLAQAANWLIWAGFAVDLAIKLVAFGFAHARRVSFWFDLVVIVLSYPLLVNWLAGVRILRLARLSRTARLARILRLSRLVAISVRFMRGLRRVLDPSAFPFVSIAVLAVIVLGALALMSVENDLAGPQRGLGDALWWAVTTVTTVGYGDIAPRTPTGRIIAVVVMFVGISFTSLLTAQVAAFLARQDQKRVESDLHADIKRLADEVASLRVVIDARFGDEPTAPTERA